MRKIHKIIRRLLGSKVTFTALTGVFFQVSRPLVSLFTVPLLYGYLGESGLGLWMIALSILGLAGFVSAGLSIRVVTEVGRANDHHNKDDLNVILTATVLVAFIFALVVLLLTLPIAFFIDWLILLNLDDVRLGNEFRHLLVLLSFVLAFGILTGIPRFFMMGRMQGYIAHVLDFIGVLVGTVGLVIAVSNEAPLWVLGLVFIVPSYLIVMVGGILYMRRLGLSMPAIKYFKKDAFQLLGRDSLKMAGYQSAYAVSSQSDLILIGIILGAPASAIYGVAQRIFSLPILLATAVNHAQWPVMARADSENKSKEVIEMFLRTLMYGSGGALVAALVTFAFYEEIQTLLVGYSLQTGLYLLIGMVAWVLVATLVNTCDTLLRARGESSLLMRSMIIMSILNLSLTMLLLSKIGSSGAIWGSVISYLLVLLIPYLIKIYQIYNNSDKALNGCTSK